MAKSAFSHRSNDIEGAKWLRRSLRSGASLLVVGSLLASATAYAQDDPAEDETEEGEVADTDEVIIVRGIRGALETAATIKRDSDTFVDSITASDISTLPDLSAFGPLIEEYARVAVRPA